MSLELNIFNLNCLWAVEVEMFNRQLEVVVYIFSDFSVEIQTSVHE